MGNYRKSLEEYKKYNAVKVSVFTEQSLEKLSEMEARYETEKKQQQIEILVKDSQVHEAELRKKQIVLYSLWGGLFFLIISSGMITFLFIQKIRTNRKLVEKNLELMKQEDESGKNKWKDEGQLVVKDEEKERIIQNIEILMKKEMIFSQPQLSMSEMAEKLDTNTAYLSRIINDYYQMNFSNFINRYRILEAQRFFANQKHKLVTLESIAGMVGFHSRPSFNAAFKKFTGVTPTVFIKNLDNLQK
jgi:AraC-like DNA-binding protein